MSLLLLFGGGSGPAAPPATTATYEMAFGYRWGDESPVWTDVTPWVEDAQGTTVKRGRSVELDRFQTGSINFTLRNDDRIFDPLYDAGLYYGDLRPNVPVRVRVGNNPIGYGYVDGWPQTYTIGNRIAAAGVSASDAFKLFSRLSLFGAAFTLDSPTLGVLDEDRLAGDVFATQPSNERVDALLSVAGWPMALRDIGDGSTDCVSQDSESSLLDALQLVEESEDGFLYMGADGAVTWVGRHGRQTLTRMTVSQATFSDAASSPHPYAQLRYRYDDQLIYNDVRRTRDGGVEQVAVDTTSITDYFRQTNSKTGLLMDADDVAHDLATVFLERYREPVLRIDSLVVDVGNNWDELFPLVQSLQILDRVTVERTPQETGDPIDQDLWIQGIEHTFGVGRWTTTFYLTPVDPFTLFTLDDADLGVLDEDLIGA